MDYQDAKAQSEAMNFEANISARLSSMSIQPISTVFTNIAGNATSLNQAADTSNNSSAAQGPSGSICSTGTAAMPPACVQVPQPSLDHNNDQHSLSASQAEARQVFITDLPIFDGKPEQWLPFLKHYVQTTKRCGFTNQENLIRLQTFLKGPALEAVRDKLMIPATVPFAIKTLGMLYGSPEIIYQSLKRDLKKKQLVPKSYALIFFACAVRSYREIMQAAGLADYLKDPMLLNELLEELPSDLKLDWGHYSIAFPVVDVVLFEAWLSNLSHKILNDQELKDNAEINRLKNCTKFLSLRSDEGFKFIHKLQNCGFKIHRLPNKHFYIEHKSKQIKYKRLLQISDRVKPDNITPDTTNM